MSGPVVPPDSREPADLEAASWLVRHDRGLTAVEQDEFLQWMADDARHGEWFARHRRTWMDFNLLAQWRPEHGAEPNADLLARAPGGKGVPPRRVRRSAVLRFGMLAAAAGLVLAGGLWLLRPGPDPGSRMSVVASGYEQRVLADGTVIDLNRGARISVEDVPGERRVHLIEGEAQFNVASDPNRPFIVRAGGVDVRAVGTAFNVRLAKSGVEILVTEGRVHVDRPALSAPPAVAVDPARLPAFPKPVSLPLAELIAGQRTVVSFAADAPAPRVLAATAEDMSRLLAWQPQLLEFDSAPLREVVAEFNRRNPTRIVLGDEELGALPIVASFRSDNLDGFVRLLELTAEVRAERRGGNEIVLRRGGVTHQP